MPCFWQDFVKCEDPSCVDLATVYAAPQFSSGSISAFPLQLYSDIGLSVPITPATATITHVLALDPRSANSYTCGSDINNCNSWDWAQGNDETGLDVCGLNYSVPWGTSPRESPGHVHASLSTIIGGDCSVSFDPSGSIPLGSVAALDYDSMAGTIAGNSGPWTIVVTIETDLGVCALVCGTSFCF